MFFKTVFFTQLKWLLWRTYLSTIRDPMATKINLIQTIVNLDFIALLKFKTMWILNLIFKVISGPNLSAAEVRPKWSTTKHKR